MSNPNKEVLEYRGQYTAERYNQFFNPNICHVCKSVDRGNLILCDRCSLISYCSEEHKIAHHMEHAEICTIIAEVLKETQGNAHKYSNWQQWIQSRKELLELIQQKFNRPMGPYMQQMILWSKSCVVCHQQNKLQVCERCFSANCCNEHAKVFGKKHNEAKCDRLMRLLNIDIETISGKTTNISYKFLVTINLRSRFEEMLEFYIEYILMQRKHLGWLAKDYVQSDYFSEPLTIYSGLQRLNSLDLLQKNNIIIHIIAVSSVERDGLPAWEVLLHLIPEMHNLTIIMIGPELEHMTDVFKLCFLCVHKKKKLTFSSFSMLYHDYLRPISTTDKIPDMIVRFDAELDIEVWSESIKEMLHIYRPLFLGCSSQKKAQDNIIKIKKILCKNVEPIFNKRNHFSGLAPHRDLETGDTYFRNEYLIIYENLVPFDNDESNNNLDE